MQIIKLLLTHLLIVIPVLSVLCAESVIPILSIIPAFTGIQKSMNPRDSRFRGNDGIFIIPVLSVIPVLFVIPAKAGISTYSLLTYLFIYFSINSSLKARSPAREREYSLRATAF